MLLKKFRIFVALASGFVLFLLLGVHLTVKADGDTVYVIPIEETVEKGLSKFLERSFQEAEDMNAKHIILDINTPAERSMQSLTWLIRYITPTFR